MDNNTRIGVIGAGTMGVGIAQVVRPRVEVPERAKGGDMLGI